MAFSRPEYWSGLPYSPPGDLSKPEIEPAPLASPALAGRFFTTSSTCYSVAQLCSTLQPHGLQLAQTHAHWVGDAIQPLSFSVTLCSPPSSSVTPFSCPQSCPASGAFPMSQLFASGGQSIGASASVLPINIYGWFPLGLTGLISLLSKGSSRVLSNTTVWKHQFFGAQFSLWSSSHICTWLLEKKHIFGYMDLCQQSDVSTF